MIRITRIRGVLAATALAALMIFAVACGNGEASDDSEANPTGVSPAESAAITDSVTTAVGTAVASISQVASTQVSSSPQPVVVAQGVPVTSQGASYAPGVAGAPYVQAISSQAGISVTGEGIISLEPDLALLNIGVESMSDTVGEARGQAAQAMDTVLAALKDRGVEDKDIQTRFFNIWPRYEWMEVIEDGQRSGKQVLVGYTVSNSASVKIRDLDAVGDIIDEVATAGGDLIRINGISFTVENPKPFMTALREAAVNDALAKAQHFAALTGVSLGRLVFITEFGGGSPVVRDFGDMERFAVAAAAPAPGTSISGGELDLRLSVQAVFDIQ